MYIIFLGQTRVYVLPPPPPLANNPAAHVHNSFPDIPCYNIVCVLNNFVPNNVYT